MAHFASNFFAGLFFIVSLQTYPTKKKGSAENCCEFKLKNQMEPILSIFKDNNYETINGPIINEFIIPRKLLVANNFLV